MTASKNWKKPGPEDTRALRQKFRPQMHLKPGSPLFAKISSGYFRAGTAAPSTDVLNGDFLQNQKKGKIMVLLQQLHLLRLL
jgi:hypothetical protein